MTITHFALNTSTSTGLSLKHDSIDDIMLIKQIVDAIPINVNRFVVVMTSPLMKNTFPTTPLTKTSGTHA